MVCRETYEAQARPVQRVIAAANARLAAEVAAARAELEAELEGVKTAAAKAAARAKAQRQNAHIAEREARQAALKETVTERYRCLVQVCIKNVADF